MLKFRYEAAITLLMELGNRVPGLSSRAVQSKAIASELVYLRQAELLKVIPIQHVHQSANFSSGSCRSRAVNVDVWAADFKPEQLVCPDVIHTT
jgi:hypothetical protein